MKILVDADAFIAMNIETDELRKKTIQCIDWLEKKDPDFYVTWDVIDEVSTKLRYAANKETAFQFLDEVYSGRYEVILPVEDFVFRSLKIFKEIVPKHTSLTYCMNIAVYRKLEMDVIFSFDKGYKKAGLTLLQEVVLKY